MKRNAALAAAAVTVFAAGGATVWRMLPDHAGGRLPDAAGTWLACFTPPEDCTGLIRREVGRARESVLVQAYAFTSPPIAQALVEAHRRGVRVQVILDRSALGDRSSVGSLLSRAGVPVLVDDPNGIAHNKVMVIDGATVLTGSFNFTRSAEERNAENLLVLRDPGIAAAYAENWERRAAEAVRFSRRRHGTGAGGSTSAVGVR